MPERQRIVLLAAREAGYRSLMRLNSRAFLDTPSNEPPRLQLDWLKGETEGVIALTGGLGGPLDAAIVAGQDPLAASRLEALLDLFGDRLYVELQRHGMSAERQAEPALVQLAYDKGIPLVATNEPYFATAQDYEAHDALIAIAESRVISDTDRRQLTAQHRFKTRAEMVELFKDLPEAIASTVEIAERSAFRPRTHKPILPRFSVGEDGAAVDEAAELRKQAEEGLTRRLAAHGLAEGHSEQDYRDRLEFELGVIERMKYPGYFLIVADFIKWAKSKDIPVGPGRGSGAGSLVAYSLTITDLDPIRFGLLFERFLNPERVSMPDFDIDFCQDRRDEVIRYVQERYGRDQVAQIITFGTLQARGVLRDVGRVLQMPYGQVDKLCKLVPQNPANPVTLAKAIEDEPKLQAEAEAEPVVKRAFAIAKKLEGLNRHASTHAAGIVIGDRSLSELVPLYRDPRSDMPVTQFNMKWVEQAGLVKFDFLGLKTLTVLQTAVKLVRRRGIDIDLSAIPLDDTKTYEMLARAEAVGVFQLESAGMRRALLDMQPDRFTDIIALVALYRPGPMANIPTYCARKHGLEEPDYIHPKLEAVLKETFGVIVYQEQVMQAAQILAGYSLGDADLLRRAMGKKIRSEMQKQRSIFVKGCTERGIDKAQADAIFDLLERFAEYGFNKSHAAAYALVAYQTAYMKANYPVEFLAATMTLDMNNTDKLSEFRAEAERLGIEVAPPSINRSCVPFEVDGNTIVYALAALKGVGEQAVESIVDARGDKPFADLADFAQRINPRALNKRVLESLAGAGAFDRLRGKPRPRLRRRRCRPAPGPARPRVGVGRPERTVRRRRHARAHHPAAGRALAAAGAPAARARRGRLLSLRPSARRLRGGAQEDARAVVGGLLASGQERHHRRPRRRHCGLAHGAAHAHRQQDGHHRAVGPDRHLRGGDLLGGLGRIPRPVGARQRAAAVPVGGSAGRRGARAHPVGRAARCRRRQPAQGPARVPARRQAARGGGQAPGADRAQRRAQRRRRGEHDRATRRRHRSRDQIARPLQGLAADRRRVQGGARRAAGRGAVGGCHKPRCHKRHRAVTAFNPARTAFLEPLSIRACHGRPHRNGRSSCSLKSSC